MMNNKGNSAEQIIEKKIADDNAKVCKYPIKKNCFKDLNKTYD